MMMISKPPPRPTPISVNGRRLPPEPCSPGEEGHLSKSLGDTFLLTGGMLPLHRQISEVTSITHAGYLFKRSNRPHQPDVLSHFPLDHLEIAMDGDGIEATPVLHPKPSSAEDAFLRNSLLSHSNGDNHQFPAPVVSLAARFHGTQDLQRPQPARLESVPIFPLLAPDITLSMASISTKATEFDESEEPLLSEAAQTRKRQLALEQSLNSPAAFFGINIDSAFPTHPSQALTPSVSNINNGVTPSPPTVATTYGQAAATDRVAQVTSLTRPTQPPPNRSVPIKMNLQRESQSSFNQTAVHRRCSAPCVYESNASPAEDVTLNSNRSRPTDYVDPRDGHLWRAKYCVLDDGILYFYRNAEDADSQEAKKERLITDPFADDSSRHRASAADSKDLSKSPMASRSLIKLTGADGSSFSGSNSDPESGFMWEKRVALNCVGAVRSAETEYGANAFELLAVDDEEDEEGFTNKLVLKAPQQEDMNEWLFQFHRSLASFVRNVMDFVGATGPSYALGDIHHPIFDQDNYSNIQTPLRSINVPAFSPRIKHTGTMPSPSVTPLSHGHGRSDRRRRKNNGLSTQSVHSVPTTPMSQSPTNFPFAPTSAIAHVQLVTPLNNGGLRSPENEVQESEQNQVEVESEDRPPEQTAPISANPPETERPPAPAKGGKYVPPHLRKKKYVPPHLRNKEKDAGGGSSPKPKQKYVPPHLRNKNGGGGTGSSNVMSNCQQSGTVGSSGDASAGKGDLERSNQAREVLKETAIKLGGCADPQVISGSIMDAQFTKRKSSRVGKMPTNAHGSEGGGGKPAAGSESLPEKAPLALKWETGAVSVCGVRDSNEDAFLIANDLLEAFGDVVPGTLAPTYWDDANHQSGLFAIFDGHCGNEAARFVAERLPHFLYGESVNDYGAGNIDPKTTEEIMKRAIVKLDEEFCRVCVEDGRDWDSGSTAVVAMLANEHLVIANIGDCRGVLCRLVEDGGNQHAAVSGGDDWNELPAEHGGVAGQNCFWMEVAEVHSPSRQDEKDRIEQAGGWTTTSKEIPVSQLVRMDFSDEDVRDILQRCFQIKEGEGAKTCSSAPQRILEITTVCGDLAVSRAIGDRDYKAASNMESDDPDNADGTWECQLFLTYPDDHSRRFVGDLVSGQPDFQTIRVGEFGMEGEFLLLACDGLWDVMDMDDAVRVTRDLLFEKNCPTKQAAARLAELAQHLGSSDNITVVVIRFLAKGQAR